MAEAKRSQIRKKVTAAESRNKTRAATPTLTDRAGETAVEAKDKFAAFARQHPIATVAGGIAVGILVSGFFRGSPTRKAGRKLGEKAAGLAALGAELAVAYAQHAMEAANEARQSGAETLGSWSDEAAEYLSGASESVRERAREGGKSLRQALRDRLN
jgi:hypothetical protein